MDPNRSSTPPAAGNPSCAPPGRLQRAARATLRALAVLAERSSNASSLLLFSITLLLFAGIVWAALAELDEVTRGQGKVIPSQQLQVVQSLEGGIVRQIFVSEGDVVQAGQPLMELDPTIHRSQYEQVLQQYYAQLAQAHRLEAEASDRKLQMPQELLEKAPVQAAAETSLYVGRQNELRVQLGALREQLAQKQQELVASEATLSGAERSLELARQSRDVIRRLVSKGLEAQLSLISEESKVSDLEYKVAATRADIARLRSAIQEVREKVETTVVGFRSAAL
ncbi:MAG TPA: biotin/lipoyl-binding protein, partial [Steroidobacteraceae bacterium]